MNFNESDVSDKSAYIRNLQPLDDEQVEDIDEHYRNRLRYLQAVDEAVASIVSLLKAVNQLDRTYIFFTSDNGFYLGNLRMPCGKNTPYMENIHVPLIMRGPGIPQGKVIEGLADNVDLAPTWAELAAQRYLIWTAVRWCRC